MTKWSQRGAHRKANYLPPRREQTSAPVCRVLRSTRVTSPPRYCPGLPRSWGVAQNREPPKWAVSRWFPFEPPPTEYQTKPKGHAQARSKTASSQRLWSAQAGGWRNFLRGSFGGLARGFSSIQPPGLADPLKSLTFLGLGSAQFFSPSRTRGWALLPSFFGHGASRKPGVSVSGSRVPRAGRPRWRARSGWLLATSWG